jgi:hypothetical protein
VCDLQEVVHFVAWLNDFACSYPLFRTAKKEYPTERSPIHCCASLVDTSVFCSLPLVKALGVATFLAVLRHR